MSQTGPCWRSVPEACFYVGKWQIPWRPPALPGNKGSSAPGLQEGACFSRTQPTLPAANQERVLLLLFRRIPDLNFHVSPTSLKETSQWGPTENSELSWPSAKPTEAWLVTWPILLILCKLLGLPPWDTSPLDIPSEIPRVFPMALGICVVMTPPTATVLMTQPLLCLPSLIPKAQAWGLVYSRCSVNACLVYSRHSVNAHQRLHETEAGLPP